MIGNVIQSQFLALRDYPTAAALSFILMAAILVLVLDLRAGARHEADRMTRASVPARAIAVRVRRRHLLDGVRDARARATCFLPIAIVDRVLVQQPARAASTTRGRASRSTTGCTRSPCPGLSSAIASRSRSRCSRALVATALGTLIALALVRYRFRGSGDDEPPHLRADDDAGDRARRVAADALPQLEDPAGLRDDPDRAHHVQHLLRRRHREGAARRLRPAPRGGGDGSRRERVVDVLPRDAAADRARRSSPAGCSRSRSRSTTS